MRKYALLMLAMIILITMVGCGGGGGGSFGQNPTRPGGGTTIPGIDDPPAPPTFPDDNGNGSNDNNNQPGTVNVFTGRVVDNINENSYSGFVVSFGASGMYAATTGTDGRFTLTLPLNTSYLQIYVAGGGTFRLRDTSNTRQLLGAVYNGVSYDPDINGDIYINMPSTETWNIGTIRVVVLLNPPS
ncbi:MAG: hypothetical protein SNJ70_10340 [Armatimonadota bacterium]